MISTKVNENALMFYENHPHQALRFGDIVSGLVLNAASVDNPNAEFKKDYHIEVYHPDFAVILSPCCSIGDKTIALTPLLPVLPQWLKNPYFREDLTRINRPMKPEQSVSPEDWARMNAEENKDVLIRLSQRAWLLLSISFMKRTIIFLCILFKARKWGLIQYVVAI